LGEKISGTSCEAYEFLGKTVPEIFLGALAKEWLLKCKTSFLPANEKMFLIIGKGISEMKQTNN
jgi:hypothetical protein